MIVHWPTKKKKNQHGHGSIKILEYGYFPIICQLLLILTVLLATKCTTEISFSNLNRI